MALSSTLYRFHIDVSDVDRGIYRKLSLRVAMHASESFPFLLTRIIAYVLNLAEGLAFTNGISNPDDPALEIRDATGTILVWIDIGNPSAKRIHKASKAAGQVKIYTYRDPALLDQEVKGQDIYRRSEIEVWVLKPDFLKRLEVGLERDNTWEVLHTDGELSINARGVSVQGEIFRHSLPT